MRLEFEYTADDLREAMTTAQLALSRPSRASFVWALVSVAGAFVYCKILERIVQTGSHYDALVLVICPLVPLILVLGASLIQLYVGVSRRSLRPWDAPAWRKSPATSRWRRWRQLAIGTLFIVYGCGFAILNERLFDVTPSSAAFTDGFCAWMATIGVITLWAHATNRIRARSEGVWEMQTQLHGPFRIDIDDQNVVISGTRSSSRLRWTAFQGFTETPNLIILYLSTTAFHMLPKRAITSPTDLNELSRILVQYVQRGHLFPRPSAFPVSPIPAIPVETVPESQI